MGNFETISKCRVCKSDELTRVLSIDDQYIATTFVKSNKDHPMANVKIPMTLMLCKECGLVQLLETVNPDLLYQNYFYRTAINDTMRRDLKDFVDDVMTHVTTESGDCVVDIGANDCTMISMFPDYLYRIGVEPAKNINWDHLNKSIHIVNDYFGRDAVLKVTKGKKVKIITATAMFYDFDNPNIATKDIKELLDDEGVCGIQVSHLLATIKDMNFYDIVHEHLEYYSLESINYLMEKNGLTVFDASTNFVNGGSLRVLVTHKDRNVPKSKKYLEILAEEEKWHLRNPDTYYNYNKKILEYAKISRDFVLKVINNGGLVIGLGASTKGNVLLQLCGIDKTLLPYISDRNKEKIGLRTLGTDIEIISEEAARKLNPSAMLVIPWNFKDEIIRREKEYILSGGKLLFLMPYPHYVDKDGEKRL